MRSVAWIFASCWLTALPAIVAGQGPLNELADVSAPGMSEPQVRGIVEEHLREHELQFTAFNPASLDAPTGGDAPAGSVVGQDLSMTARWNNGLELATKDEAFRVHVGGRWQFDTSWLSADDDVQNNLPGGVQYHDGVNFRRARLRIDGTMYEVMEFAMEYDFVNGFRERNGAATSDINVTALTDLWLQFSHLPLGNLRVGNHKEPIGFDHLVSSRFLPFLERSYNQDIFYGGAAGGFTPGASLFSNIWDDRASWNIGLYKPTNNVFGFNANDGDYAVVGRVTWLPVYEDEGRQLIHLGLSGRQATTYDDRIRFRTREAMRAGVSTQWPVPADITVQGSTMQWLDAELAVVQGPWTFQAEWLMSFTSNAQRLDANGAEVGPQVDSLFYQGGYVQLLYFLTGESDNYSLERMAFDRVKPHENSFWVTGDDGCNWWGRGAWQVGARYNYLDLDDQGINGGQLHNFTAGLNWFFNPNTKWQFNYIATFRDVDETATFPDGSGWIHGWGMRFAQDF
jgi:phosphate-selective porin OprO/OprP